MNGLGQVSYESQAPHSTEKHRVSHHYLLTHLLSSIRTLSPLHEQFTRPSGVRRHKSWQPPFICAQGDNSPGRQTTRDELYFIKFASVANVFEGAKVIISQIHGQLIQVLSVRWKCQHPSDTGMLKINKHLEKNNFKNLQHSNHRILTGKYLAAIHWASTPIAEHSK